MVWPLARPGRFARGSTRCGESRRDERYLHMTKTKLGFVALLAAAAAFGVAACGPKAAETPAEPAAEAPAADAAAPAADSAMAPAADSAAAPAADSAAAPAAPAP